MKMYEWRAFEYERKLLVVPPCCGTEYAVATRRLNPTMQSRHTQHIHWEVTPNRVYCLYRPFRQRIVYAIAQWLATYPGTVDENWWRVDDAKGYLDQQHPSLVPLWEWVPPKFVDEPVNYEHMPDLFMTWGLEVPKHMSVIESTPIEDVWWIDDKINTYSHFWSALENSLAYRQEAKAIETWNQVRAEN